jgi:beta-lactamase class A
MSMERTPLPSPSLQWPRILLGFGTSALIVCLLGLMIWMQVRPGIAQSAAIPAVPTWPKPIEAATDGPPAPSSLSAQIRALGAGFDGKVGIAVRSVDAGWTASWFGGGLFPQQSVSKLWVAAAVMDQIDAGRLRITDPVTITNADLTVFHQPIRAKLVGTDRYNATIDDLLFFAMTQSDNTANDVLFRRVGGQTGVGRFLERARLSEIAMSRGEIPLQTSIAGLSWDPSYSYGQAFWKARAKLDASKRWATISAYVANPVDGATPVAITRGLARLKRGELLSRQSTGTLLDLMDRSTTGPSRLRGGLSPGWSLAHKTGTGQVFGRYATGYNDVGILTAPDGQSYALAVMIGATYRTVPQRQVLMQSVTRAVIACVEGGGC